MWERERERGGGGGGGGERKRERDRQADRQTDRDRQTDKNRQIDRHTDPQTHTDTRQKKKELVEGGRGREPTLKDALFVKHICSRVCIHTKGTFSLCVVSCAAAENL